MRLERERLAFTRPATLECEGDGSVDRFNRGTAERERERRQVGHDEPPRADSSSKGAHTHCYTPDTLDTEIKTKWSGRTAAGSLAHGTFRPELELNPAVGVKVGGG